MVRQPRNELVYRGSDGLVATLANATRHHVLISVTCRAGVGKAADQITSVILSEALYVLNRVRYLDADQAVAFGQPDFGTTVLEQSEDSHER